MPKEAEFVDLNVAGITEGIVGGVSAVLLIILGVYLYDLSQTKGGKEGGSCRESTSSAFYE